MKISNSPYSISLKILLISVLFLMLCKCGNFSTTESYNPKRLLGMSFVAADEQVTEEDIQPFKDLGVTWVSLMPYGFVREAEHIVQYNTPHQWRGETDAGLEETILLAKSMGLKVMIKPHVWFRHGEFTGAYVPPDSALTLFKNSFEEFVLHYARLSKKADADLYCIGTEWHKFIDSDPKFWIGLIAKVKEIYSGPLTYAANWDEYQTVPFWKEMDYIGVNAYFPISDKKFPKLDELANGWQNWSENLASMAHSEAKPILFTEYGYRSTVNTAEKPWESYTELEVSLENQTNAYTALYNEFWDKPWFVGGFAWKWFRNHKQHGGEGNNDFTPQNKPVEEVIKSYYQNTPR